MKGVNNTVMTNEQYYWYIRRNQLLNAKYAKVPGNFDPRIKQLKPYLYELNLADFTEDYEVVIQDTVKNSFACSSVRKGNYHGRNYDMTFDDIPYYVVHVGKTQDHYKFTGIAKAVYENGQLTINKIPNLMLDGVNENGVVVNMNVVSKADLDDSGLTNSGTNPGAKPVHFECGASYILSKAESAVDAVVRMKRDINLFGYLKFGLFSEYIHYMISDKDDTFVVEVIGDKICVLGFDGNKNNDRIEGIRVRRGELPIMTNWYLNYDEFPLSALVKDYKYTLRGCGIERYNLLSSNYYKMDSMFDIMKSAKYTNEKDFSVYDQNFPFSDVVGYSTVGLHEYETNISGVRDFIDNDIATMKYAVENNVRDTGIWITRHNTVYNIDDLSFTLVFEEDYEHPMKFKLNQ